MRNAKTLVILLLVTIAVAAAAFFARDQSVQTDLAGEPLFPDLLAGINDTAAVTLQTGGETMTFKPEGERWGLAERGGYPVDQEGIRELLLGLAQLKRIEAKTSNPERYVEIGLEDPAQEDSAATRLTVSDASGAATADVIVGDRKLGRGGQSKTQLYVRLPDDPQSWLAEGNLPDKTDASEWLEAEVLSLEEDRIREARVVHADGEELLVSRGDAAVQDYTLAGLGEDEQTKSSYEVNSVATSFAMLELEDVRAREPDKEYPEPQLTASMETFDGLRVSMEVLELDGERLARLSAEHFPVESEEPASAEATAEEPDATGTNEETVEAEDAGAETTSAEAAEAEEPESDTTPSTAEEAASLNERWQGWLYEVTEYQLNAITKRRADLVEPIVVEEEAAEEKPEGSS